jgi:hypothetical protein
MHVLAVSAFLNFNNIPVARIKTVQRQSAMPDCFVVLVKL